MPNVLYVKYPSASRTLAWQFVFPSNTVRSWRDTGDKVRWQCSPSTLRRAFKQAVKLTKVYKHVGVHNITAQLCQPSP